MGEKQEGTGGEEPGIHAWLIRYIKRQRFVESLEWIREQIKADVDDGFAYTKEASKMTELRECFQRQMKLARQEQ